MRDERIHVRVKVHPFGLPLLFVDIRHPDQRSATRGECTPNLWHQQVWDEAREETAWSENKKVCLRDCSKRTSSCSY
jgi:hypothetical protein